MPPLAVSAVEYTTPTWPPGNEVVVITSGAVPVTEIVRPTVAICCGLLESVTLNVIGVALALTVGVPLMTPVDALSVSPVGKGMLPVLSDHVYGAAPPAAARAKEYGVLICAFGIAPVVMLSVDTALVMVSVKVAVAVCGVLLESATLKVIATFDAAAVGVPLRTPVAERLRPAGRLLLVVDQA